MGNVYGTLFRVMTFGESHGPAIGCVIDGCPPGIKFSAQDVDIFLARRRPGSHSSDLTSARKEPDNCVLLSGVENETTLGTPVAILIPNRDVRTGDYSSLSSLYRPGHADYTVQAKYGISPATGGGRSSARETAGRVAAAALAKACVQNFLPTTEITAWVSQVAQHQWNSPSPEKITWQDVAKSEVCCPDDKTSQQMKEAILAAKADGDSVGGVITCVIRGLPVGLGAPVFERLEACLASALLSIPACKSFDMGNGREATHLRGSENNDPYTLLSNGKIGTLTNRCGGIQGGISNGMPVVFSAGFKPVSTIFKEQMTVERQTLHPVSFKPHQGRHDPCVLPRAVPIVEAMTWLVVAEHVLRQNAIRPNYFSELSEK